MSVTKRVSTFLKQLGKSTQSMCNSVKDQLSACIDESKKDKIYIKESGKQLRVENQKLRDDVKRLEEDRKYLSMINYKLSDTVEELKHEIAVAKLKSKTKSKLKPKSKSMSRSRTYYV